ncbi:MAG: hypothetical protein JXB10_09400 [Pirellulales bacterium]|nr:hypothetical protein [Pirellulales bacterium]
MIYLAVVALIVSIVFWTGILFVTFWLYSKMVGGQDSPSALPDPTMKLLVGVGLSTALIQIGTWFIPILNSMIHEHQLPLSLYKFIPLALLISFSLRFLAAAGLISIMLPTTVRRGAIVAMLYMGIGIVSELLFLALYLFRFFTSAQ